MRNTVSDTPGKHPRFSYSSCGGGLFRVPSLFLLLMITTSLSFGNCLPHILSCLCWNYQLKHPTFWPRGGSINPWMNLPRQFHSIFLSQRQAHETAHVSIWIRLPLRAPTRSLVGWYRPEWASLCSMVKNLPAIPQETGSIPGLGRSPGEGHGNPLQYSCLKNPIGRGAWQATVHRVVKSWTWLKWLSTHWPEWWVVMIPSLPHP